MALDGRGGEGGKVRLVGEDDGVGNNDHPIQVEPVRDLVVCYEVHLVHPWGVELQ